MLAPVWDIWIDAEPPSWNGLQLGRVGLRVRLNRPHAVDVLERDGRRRFPAYCPERHINHGGGFCLGHQERLILASNEAVLWWRDLHQFLLLQTIAEQTGHWPAAHALSHGAAADHELKAREALRSLGVEADYISLLDGEPSWLSKAVEDADPDNHGLPLGWRRRNAPVGMHCSPRKWSRSMISFVAAERERRRQVDAFWEDAIRKGRRCCGSMAFCRLRSASPNVRTPHPPPPIPQPAVQAA